ncbi:MAG: xanthine dehydrogenase family protein molybdopterin-binding subunit [Proteobacteria bacterium]|nr:xanthine dehydrogenase family protein molybdopterin-binding subunit [Pseudomonadota bacterium]
MTRAHDASRRRFLKVLGSAGGALIVGVQTRAFADVADELVGDVLLTLNPYVRIEPDGTVVIGARDPEVGQGIRTAEARIIAEELDADWPRVVVLPMALGAEDGNGEPRWTFGHQEARGSTGIPAAWNDLRSVGATARELLVRAAAQRLGVGARTLRTQLGRVIAADGRSLDYGQLATAASQLPPANAAPALKSPEAFRLIGQDAGDADARDIVTGRQRHAIDQMPGDALVAVIARCPYPGGALKALDAADARALKGVAQVLTIPPPDPAALLGIRPLAAGVAVLAEDTWTALRGRDLLKIEWRAGAAAHGDDALAAQLDARFEQAPTTPVRNDGDYDQARKLAHRAAQARYRIATVAHAELEPPNCIAQVASDHALVIAPLQNPRGALDVVQRLTGLRPSQVEIRLPRGGGGMGRTLDNDHVAEAVMLAKAAKKPVKLMWTRADAFAHDAYRPFAVHDLAAGLDRKNRITAWRQRIASTSRLAGRGEPRERWWLSEAHPDDLPAGLIDNYRLDWFALDSSLPRGNWRAGSHGINAFATQVFLDEIAVATKQDPLQLRLDLLGEPRALPYRGHGGPVLDTGRLAEVLKLAADAIGWKKKRNDGHGLGLAFHFTYGGYVAHALEVSMQGARLVMHKAVIAADLGRVINPLGARAALTGATLDGLSTALGLRITLKDGCVAQRDFKDYPLATMAQLPREVQVILVPSQEKPTGAYEMGLPGAAPALANAVFAATTVRVRSLPILPELMRLL